MKSKKVPPARTKNLANKNEYRSPLHKLSKNDEDSKKSNFNKKNQFKKSANNAQALHYQKNTDQSASLKGDKPAKLQKPHNVKSSVHQTSSNQPLSLTLDKQFMATKLTGELPTELAPLILETLASDDYALLDSGNGLKLERYGPYTIIRPEAQALWQANLSQQEWQKADAIFTGNLDEEGLGRWNFPQTPLGETWPMAWNGMAFLGRFTSFRHVGVFPEQDAHWRFMEEQIIKAQRPVRVLNLFGYTGVASLIAARAGAEVTHVDASKKAIGWARENQQFAGLNDKPIRWICEDAMKFVEREARRGKSYDIILLDPPAYGRGPHGEVWQLFDHLSQMVAHCRAILSKQPIAIVLTAYSIRASFYAIHELMREQFRGLNGQVQSGELILREQQSKRALSTSLFSRWIAS